MACYRPRIAWWDKERGKLWFRANPYRKGVMIELPCQRCIGCAGARRRSWAVRMTHEAQLYASNWFVTFTYDEKHLPASRSLEYRDFQLFMKRLREAKRGVTEVPEAGWTRPIRFFVAGEYGEVLKRPHWHAVLFNLYMGDEKLWQNGRSHSAELEKLWGKGNVLLDAVTAASTAYVAGYVNKKLRTGSAEDYEDVLNTATGELTMRQVEFQKMSRDPGLGLWWFRRYGSDVFPNDFAYVDGKRFKVPPYYWGKFRDTADPAKVEEIRYERLVRAELRIADETPERRAVREELALRRHEAFRTRRLE